MINFKQEESLQVIYVTVDEVIKWSEQQLKSMFGFDFKVWCNPSISENYLSYNIDETEMNEEQWFEFSKKLETQSGYWDGNFKKLLIRAFGEAEYVFRVNDLDAFYIIKHEKLNK